MTHSTAQSVRYIVAALKSAHKKKVYSQKNVRFAIQICAGAHPQTVKQYMELLIETGILEVHNDGFVLNENAFIAFIANSKASTTPKK